MYTKRLTLLGRSLSAAAIAMAIGVGGAGIASASGHHNDGPNGSNCASGRVSSFEYANSGVGGFVSAVSATSITVDQWRGVTSTFTIAPSTTIDIGSTTTSASSIVVGDRVRIQATSSDPTTAASITIELAMLFGQVSSVGSTTFTITDPQGFTRTIDVSSATTYEFAGSAGTYADVVVGAKIIARGTVDANGTSLDALSVDVGTAGTNQFVEGVVTNVTGSSLTIENSASALTTFTLGSNTVYREGPLDLTLADVVDGEHVGVEFNSSASTTALRVDIRLAHVDGRVTAVSGLTINVGGQQGASGNILVSAATQYFAGRTPATFADVVVGAHIIALGTPDVNGTSLDALYVEIFAPSVSPPSPQGPASNTFGNGGHEFGNGNGNGNGNDNGNGSSSWSGRSDHGDQGDQGHGGGHGGHGGHFRG
jgi:hypothetical protein